MKNYQSIFEDMLYELCLNAYEESFTPGDYESPKGVVMLPISALKEKGELVMRVLAKRGLKPPRDFDLMRYTKEALGKIQMRKNPYTPRIPDELYEEVGFFFEPKGFFAKNPEPVSIDRKELKRQFKGAIGHTVQLWLRVADRKADEDLEYPSYEELSKALGHEASQNEMREAMKKAVLNQYRRYVMAVMVLHLVKFAYQVTPAQVTEILRAAGIDENTDLGSLRLSGNRKAFVKSLSDLMRGIFGEQNLGDAVLSRVKQKRLK